MYAAIVKGWLRAVQAKAKAKPPLLVAQPAAMC
jgi:hypothetical protein